MNDLKQYRYGGYVLVDPRGREFIDDNASQRISDNSRGRRPEGIIEIIESDALSSIIFAC
jgi:hypothetical protein